jgi:hypothetical protein
MGSKQATRFTRSQRAKRSTVTRAHIDLLRPGQKDTHDTPGAVQVWPEHCERVAQSSIGECVRRCGIEAR